MQNLKKVDNQLKILLFFQKNAIAIMNIYQRRHQKRKGIAMKKEKKYLVFYLQRLWQQQMMAGCGGKEEDTSKGEKKETENKTVSIMGWYDEDDMEGVINSRE